jgi:hypothetical protein
VAVCGLAAGCSVQKVALRGMADALSSGTGGSFARDDDPELVRDALPFALKTMESIGDGLPDHPGLRASMAAGFTQYGFAFLQQEADEVEAKDPARARHLRQRAKRLYVRARDHGLDGLRIRHGVTLAALRTDEAGRIAALAPLTQEDLPLLYWTFASWGAAISIDKRDLELVGDLPVLAAMLDRALALDEAYDGGALHELSMAFDGARSGGTTRAKQDQHYARALELGQGKRLSALLGYAENVLVQAQDRKGFEALLKTVTEFDVDGSSVRSHRLANLITQRRARFLLEHVEDLIAD